MKIQKLKTENIKKLVEPNGRYKVFENKLFKIELWDNGSRNWPYYLNCFKNTKGGGKIIDSIGIQDEKPMSEDDALILVLNSLVQENINLQDFKTKIEKVCGIEEETGFQGTGGYD